MLRNATEPDGHNNGKAHVDDAGTAHAFMAAKEKVMYDEHNESEKKKKKKKEWRPVDYTNYAMQVLAGQTEAEE